MATLQVLKSAYSDVARLPFSGIPAADLTAIQTLAGQVDASTLTLADARIEIAKLVTASTTVANLSYNFFTGATPTAFGLDYLISPTGGNGNNLNSAYYQAFSAQNRFINFAVNLGKNGAGQAGFAAAYGGLDLAAAATKAYGEIFGFAPADGLINTILTAQVPNGLGGTFTRAEYFAYYGGDGANGAGTKAAMVGFLLAVAANEHIGSYAKANDAFLADLANDGQAKFNTSLVGTYGDQPTFTTGATIAVTDTQSVSPDAANIALRSTTNNDTVTGTTNSGSILTSGGHDTVTFSGTVGGYIDGGDGDDTLSVGQLNAAVEVLGGAPNGKISGGAGNDVITVGKMIDGAIIDGGAGDDTLVMGADASFLDNTRITNVEHLVLQNFKLSFVSQNPIPGTVTTAPLTVFGYTGLQDITLKSSISTRLDNVAQNVALKMDGVGGGTLTANYHIDLVITGMSSKEVGAPVVNAYLSNVSSSNATPTQLLVTGNDGPLVLHVQSDSELKLINSRNVDANSGPIIVTGTGHLTAGFIGVTSLDVTTYNLDASSSGGIDINGIGSRYPDSHVTTVILSGFNDSVAAELMGRANSVYTLGAGADVFKLNQDGFNAPHFSNLSVENTKVTTFATITDFEKGVDHVNLGVEIASVTTGVAVGAATTLEQALINASTQVSANGTGVFEWNGDTYIYHQDGTVGVNSGDGLIKLVGVTSLTVGTGATVADIHYG